MTILLAQSSPAGAAKPAGNPLALMGVVGAMIGVVMVLTVVIMVVRRRMLAPADTTADAVGLIDQLRRMRENGQLSEAEYAAAKARLARGARGRADDALLSQRGSGEPQPARASTPVRPRPPRGQAPPSSSRPPSGGG